MDIKDIRYFIAIAESRSMSQAARDLFVSQPALSLVVKKLESEFDTKLFIRKGNTLTLTVAGEHLLKSGRSLLADHESLMLDLRQMSSTKEEIVQFGLSSFYGRQYIPHLFLYYQKNFPSVQLRPVETGSFRLEQMVIDGELEFCFVPATPQREELVYRTIGVEDFLAAIPPNHPVNRHAIAAAGYPYIDFKHIQELPFVMHTKGSKSAVFCDRLFRHFNCTPNVLFESSSRETLYALTSLGIGVSILPSIMTGLQLPYESPLFYRVSEIDMTRNYAVAHRPDKKFTPTEEHLIDTLTQLVTNQEPGGV